MHRLRYEFNFGVFCFDFDLSLSGPIWVKQYDELCKTHFGWRSVMIRIKSWASDRTVIRPCVAMDSLSVCTL